MDTWFGGVTVEISPFHSIAAAFGEQTAQTGENSDFNK
jgi:hypothetical protein